MAVKLPPLNFIVLDTETTGFVPRVHRVMEFACAVVQNGVLVEEYEQLFSIDDEIPPHIQVLTRIHPTDLQGKPKFLESITTIREYFAKNPIVVGQNIRFDIDMLKGEGLDLTESSWIDTSSLAALLFPELESYSLGYLSAVLGLRHDPKHRALGDVRATLALLECCWERLCSLPEPSRQKIQKNFARSAAGYAEFFAALPQAQETGKQQLKNKKGEGDDGGKTSVCSSHFALHVPKPGTVELWEEGLSPHTLQHIVDTAAAEHTGTQWIAVKNLDAALRRIVLPAQAKAIFPPFLLLSKEARNNFLTQEQFTADEAFVATKLELFKPHNRNEIVLHGEERDVWGGKLACTEDCASYQEQFEHLPRVLLLDHRQLLEIVAEENHIGKKALLQATQIIIDDASMLEDTATKAYGIQCSLADLRGASQGNEQCTRLTDLLQFWIEKVRHGQDLLFLEKQHLQQHDVKGLKEHLDQLLASKLPARAKSCFQNFADLLSADPAMSLLWIEQQRNGIPIIQAAPKDVAGFLEKHLYSKFPVSLLIPPGSKGLPEIFPRNFPSIRTPLPEALASPLVVEEKEISVDQLLRDPPRGKTILLLGSKRSVEQSFIRYTEDLEKRNFTLICQGFNGGINRMQAEFESTAGDALLLLTPWMYEGSEISPKTADRLILELLPFDHPSQPLIQERSKHYQNAFLDYQLPRLEHRLFRILRTFCRQRKDPGTVWLLDKRIRERSYGERIRSVLRAFAPPPPPSQELQQPLF